MKFDICVCSINSFRQRNHFWMRFELDKSHNINASNTKCRICWINWGFFFPYVEYEECINSGSTEWDVCSPIQFIMLQFYVVETILMTWMILQFPSERIMDTIRTRWCNNMANKWKKVKFLFELTRVYNSFKCDVCLQWNILWLIEHYRYCSFKKFFLCDLHLLWF